MRILRQSEVTPEMGKWARDVGEREQWLIGASEGPLRFGNLWVMAVVETHHDSTASNPVPHDHPGVTLYESGSIPEVVATHALLPEGVDLYGGQWPVNWSQVVASGRTFAYIKATEGVTVTDSRMAEHNRLAGISGLKRGAYHFFRARDGAEQIDHFLSTLDGLNWELPPVLDVEVSDGQNLQTVARRVSECMAAMPNGAGIYTMPGFWNTLANVEVNAWLWVATWGPKPLACNGLGDPKIWQYSASAYVPGYPGHADCNRVLDPEWWLTL